MSVTMLLGIGVLWVRSYYFVDLVRLRHSYSTGSYWGFGSPPPAVLHLLAFSTSPGHLYLHYRGGESVTNDFGGLESGFWLCAPAQAVGSDKLPRWLEQSGLGSETLWPEKGFQWRWLPLYPGTEVRKADDPYKPSKTVRYDGTGSLLDIVLPTWFVTLVLMIIVVTLLRKLRRTYLTENARKKAGRGKATETVEV